MDQTRSADGTPIAFERVGDGAPVILVGGAFCDHRARMAGLPLANELAGSFTVIAYDRRGRGSSGDTAPYAVAREVEDLSALIARVGGPSMMFGHSSGAILAFEAALAGLPIVKLALYEPPLVLSPEREPLPSDLVERLRSLTISNQRAELVELFITRAVGRPASAVAQAKQGPHWAGFEALAHTLRYDAELAQNPKDLLARAEKVRQPTLVLDGAKSQPWMRFAAEALAAAVPNAKHVRLPDQSHDVDPVALAPYLMDFFERR